MTIEVDVSKKINSYFIPIRHLKINVLFLSTGTIGSRTASRSNIRVMTTESHNNQVEAHSWSVNHATRILANTNASP